MNTGRTGNCLVENLLVKTVGSQDPRLLTALAFKHLSDCGTELLHSIFTHSGDVDAATANDIDAVFILELVNLHLVQAAVGKHSILR